MRFISKGICGGTLILAAGGAAAQTSVTLYGVADTFVQYLDNGGTHSVSQRSGGSTGSLFGLKGTEDLGGGVRAAFDMEGGYNLNNGTLFADTTALFYRQAWVGITSDKYGSLTAGRQYQPTFLLVYPADPFRTDEVLSPLVAQDLAIDKNTLSTQTISGRSSNSILYKSPNIGGLQLYGMYAFSASVTQPYPSTSGNMLDVAATYTNGSLYAGIGYQNRHSGVENFPTIPVALGTMGTQNFTAALSYHIGVVNLKATYIYSRPDTAPAHSTAALLGTAHSVSIAEVGATIQATAADAIAIAGVDRNVRGVHDNAPGFEVGIDHSISKRTSVYARVGYMKNNGTSAISWQGITVTGTDQSQTLAAVGITHRF